MLASLNFVLIFVIFVCHTGLTQQVKLPPSEFPKDNLTYKIFDVHNPERSETPPHVFPDNDPNYKVIQNSSILNDLKSHAANRAQNQTKIDTEVPDLIKPVLTHESQENNTQSSNSSTSDQNVSSDVTITSTVPKKPSSVMTTTEKDLEFDQEEIESDLSKTEDVKLNSSRAKSHQEHGHATRGSGPVLQGQLAAVLAGVFALIAVASYVGLLTWRRYLEHRYGNREMLINEEDHINYNDMKNFEMTVCDTVGCSNRTFNKFEDQKDQEQEHSRITSAI